MHYKECEDCRYKCKEMNACGVVFDDCDIKMSCKCQSCAYERENNRPSNFTKVNSAQLEINKTEIRYTKNSKGEVFFLFEEDGKKAGVNMTNFALDRGPIVKKVLLKFFKRLPV